MNAIIYRCTDAEAAERITAIANSGGDVETERREMVSENPLSITIEESRLATFHFRNLAPASNNFTFFLNGIVEYHIYEYKLSL